MNASEPDLTAHRYGYSGSEAATAARNSAVQHAIVVLGVHGARWPSGDEGFHHLISNRLIEELTSFCIYARRYMELRDLGGIQIQGSLWGFQPGATKYQYEGDLWVAINKILHARHLQVLEFDMDAMRFSALGDRVIPCVEVQSDRGELSYVCPTALVLSFFSTDATLPHISVST